MSPGERSKLPMQDPGQQPRSPGDPKSPTQPSKNPETETPITTQVPGSDVVEQQVEKDKKK